MEEIDLNMNDMSLELTNDLGIKQENFLETTFGKIANTALDIGLKAVLPDIIEDEIINIKDAIINNGFKEGIKEVVDSAINTGKSALGIVTGNFENISQIEMAVKKGGLLDKTSALLDTAIGMASSKNIINKEISSVLRTGKNTIIDSISDKLEKAINTQIKAIEKIEKQCTTWQDAYVNKDLSKMENSLKNIKKNLEKIVPLENVINRARTIETLHEIVKNTGKFELSEEAFQLAEKFK